MKKAAYILIICLSLVGVRPLLSNIITPRGSDSSSSSNQVIVEKFYEALSKGDTLALSALLAPNYVAQDSNAVFDPSIGKYDIFNRNFTVRSKALHSTFPGFQLSILDMLGDGTRVVASVQITGNQKGPLLGVEPTNKPIKIKISATFTLQGGKITKINEIWNEFNVMKQMGYIAL